MRRTVLLKDIIKEYSVRNKALHDYPVYSVTNSQGFCTDYFGKEVASKDKSTYKIVPFGFFAFNPSRINVGSIDWQDCEEFVIVSPLYNVFSVDESKVKQEFLLYYFKSHIVSAYINTRAKGSVRMNLSIKTLGEFPISLPSLEEQTRIVAELDLLNSAINKHKELLLEFDHLLQSIYIDMFGTVDDNKHNWTIKCINQVCTLKSGNSEANNSSEGDLPYVKVGDMGLKGNERYITTSSQFVSRQENSKGIFPIGTTIFPKRGGAISTNKKRLTSVEICCDLNTMGVIPDTNIVHPVYIFQYFHGIDLGTLCNGATIPQLNNSDIGPLRIVLPPLEIQNIFAKQVESIERQSTMVQRSLYELEQLFNGRMDFYFN